MNNNEIIELAKENNINEVIVRSSAGISQSMKYENNVFTQNTTSISDTVEMGVYIDGVKISNGLARPNKENVQELIEDFKEISKYKTKEVEEKIMDTRKLTYLPSIEYEFEPLKIEDAKKALIELYQKINASDKRIISKNTTVSYGVGSNTKTFTNSYGTNIESKSAEYFVIGFSVFGKDGTENVSTYGSRICKSIKDLDI